MSSASAIHIADHSIMPHYAFNTVGIRIVRKHQPTLVLYRAWLSYYVFMLLDAWVWLTGFYPHTRVPDLLSPARAGPEWTCLGPSSCQVSGGTELDGIGTERRQVIS